MHGFGQIELLENGKLCGTYKNNRMGTEHSNNYCRKEKEIAEIHADLQTIKKIVMGNGQEGLSVSVPKLAQNVARLGQSVDGLKTGVSGFLQYQQEQEGKQSARIELSRRNRWIIGLLVGVIIVLIGGLISSIHLLAQ